MSVACLPAVPRSILAAVFAFDTPARWRFPTPQDGSGYQTRHNDQMARKPIRCRKSVEWNDVLKKRCEDTTQASRIQTGMLHVSYQPDWGMKKSRAA